MVSGLDGKIAVIIEEDALCEHWEIEEGIMICSC